MFGVVKHQSDVSWREPKSVVLLRYQQEVASTCSFEAAGHSWRLTIDADREFAADDILKERLEVFAVDRLGGRSRLRMEGAMQLGYIREVFGAPSALELSIDFSRKGNGRDYVRDGWYGPEEEHTWTRGTYSTIELPFRVPGSKYELEILAWPFVVPGKIGSQSLVISIAGCGITRSFVKPEGNYLRYEIPPDLITIIRY